MTEGFQSGLAACIILAVAGVVVALALVGRRPEAGAALETLERVPELRGRLTGGRQPRMRAVASHVLPRGPEARTPTWSAPSKSGIEREEARGRCLRTTPEKSGPQFL